MFSINIYLKSYAPAAAQCELVYGAAKYMHSHSRTLHAFQLCCCRADALAFIPMQHSLSLLISNFKSFEKKILHR
jgi:hypothetical protein